MRPLIAVVVLGLAVVTSWSGTALALEEELLRRDIKALDEELKMCNEKRWGIEAEYEIWKKGAVAAIDELLNDKEMEADEKYKARKALTKKLRAEHAVYTSEYSKNVDKTRDLWAKLHRALDRLKKFTGGGGSGQLTQQPSGGEEEQRGGGAGRALSDEEIQRIKDDYEREMHKVDDRENDRGWDLNVKWVPTWLKDK